MIAYLASMFLLAASEQEMIRRVQAHLLIDDPVAALEEAKVLASQHDTLEAHKTLLEALSANGQEEAALDLWNRLAGQDPNFLYDRHSLEEIGWGVLRKGTQSTQYGVRLAATIGAFLTRDVRAVPILLKMMRDGNVVIRCMAFRMASELGDQPLRDEIARLMKDEKVWMARLEVMKAAGRLRMQELAGDLQTLVQSDKTTLEERGVALEALVSIYDEITGEQFRKLAASDRAGLRHLAAFAAEHFRLAGVKQDIAKLMQDAHPAVRTAATTAFGILYREQCSDKEAKSILEGPLNDTDPMVAITAGWAALLVDPAFGTPFLQKWLTDALPENRRLAAAAVAKAGTKGLKLSKTAFHMAQDPYVKANLALGLLGQREEIKPCCDFLYAFLEGEKRLWMIDKRGNALFEVLAPSQVRHQDQIPNFPEAQDQMTRLHLLSQLALVDDARSLPAIRSFLQKKKWGVSGAAAATLLHEGDEASLEVVRQLIHDEDGNVRLQACLVLALLGRDETALIPLQNAYALADHDQKLHILEALGRIGNAASYSFLMGVLREPFPVLRVAAASALVQSVNH